MRVEAYDLAYICRSVKRERQAPVHGDILAAKVQAVREFKCPELQSEIEARPRLLELLWFIQARSHAPGGLEKFTADFLAEFPERIGTAEMRKCAPSPKSYKPEECVAIWRGIPSRLWPADWEAGVYDLEMLSDPQGCDARQKRLEWEWSKRTDFAFLWRLCVDAALAEIPAFLRDLCTLGTNHMSIWCFADILGALIEMMDRHAQKVKGQLAETSVSKLVFDELAFSGAEHVPLAIMGDARFGKTKTVSVWTAMRPGVARLVTVPDSGQDWDFYAAHADALGISYNENTPGRVLRRSVEFVCRHAGLFLVYDEAHFLLPVRYANHTAPTRLNWVRCQVIDREIGCAFFATRQSYRQTLNQFVKTTGFQMEQWLGRVRTVALPEELSAADLLAIARVHFPAFEDDYLQVIVARCSVTEGYAKNLEFVAKRARWEADRHHRTHVRLADIDAALTWSGLAAKVAPAEKGPTGRRGPQSSEAPAHGARACADGRPVDLREATDETDFNCLARPVQGRELAPARELQTVC